MTSAKSSRGRPSRNATPPPPISGNSFCLSCGRLMPAEPNPSSSASSSTPTPPTPRKYCSSSCRSRGKDPSLKEYNVYLAQTFHGLLLSAKNNRTVILCSQAENQVHGTSKSSSDDPDPSLSSPNTTPLASPPSNPSPSSSATTPTPSPALLAKLPSIPDPREQARRAARRLVNFGFESQGVSGEIRGVEAVQGGKVVEGSYAKGEWGIRWRDG